MALLGFIGLRVMGREMASYLMAAGHSVQAFDVDPNAVEALRVKGAKATTGVIEAAEGATPSS
jgi:3-hydroxyisobutyrate dehydrogenase-like beta-hydroxyacid dehydrogenase